MSCRLLGLPLYSTYTYLHQDLDDGVQEWEGEDDDEVVDEPLEGELLAQAAHRDGHGSHEPGQPDEDDGQRTPAVLQIQINSYSIYLIL